MPIMEHGSWFWDKGIDEIVLFCHSFRTAGLLGLNQLLTLWELIFVMLFPVFPPSVQLSRGSF